MVHNEHEEREKKMKKNTMNMDKIGGKKINLRYIWRVNNSSLILVRQLIKVTYILDEIKYYI